MPAPRNWTIEKLLARTIRNENGCAIWQGSVDCVTGYGRIWITKEGKECQIGVHRFMASLLFGEIPEGHLACHSCDTPACIEPEHLFLGTNKDNSEDMTNKGRSAKGGKHWAAVLTESQVEEIRQSPTGYGTGIALAKKYGVAETTISAVRRGKNWKG